jgi:hypothetical protein
MPVLKGMFNQREAKTLLDTGCSSVVVRAGLVDPTSFTGESHMCFLIDGTVRHFPIAKIKVQTPYYIGDVEAMCMENPVYDLIIGNVPGARDPGDPDEEYIPDKIQSEVSPI